MIVGYARVRQMARRSMLNISADGCGSEQVFAEKQSGIKTDRAALARCLRSLAPGDVLLVTKLRSAGAEHSRFAQHPSGNRRSQSGLQVAG